MPNLIPTPPRAFYETLFAGPFGALSALRHSRSVHPQGVLCRGRLRIERGSPLAPASTLLQPGVDREVIARFSRMTGLPEQVGDVFGLAVRVLDAYGPGRDQDLLCNTSLDLPGAHRVFLPAPRWFAQTYSSCLPYRAGAGPFVIGWQPAGGEGPGPSVEALRGAVRDEGTTFGVAVAAPLGHFRRLGELRLDTLVDLREGDIDFDPVAKTGGGLALTGALNEARTTVYRSSRRGRGAGDEPRRTPVPG